MAPSEFTVEVLSKTETISMPWHLSPNPTPVNPESLQKRGYTIPTDGGVILPHSWIFNSDSTLSPYEFYFADKGDEVEIPKDFLVAVHTELKKLQLDSVLGLHLLHRGPGIVGEETSSDSDRANVLALKEQFDDKEMMNVVWSLKSKSARPNPVPEDVEGAVEVRCYPVWRPNGQPGHDDIPEDVEGAVEVRCYPVWRPNGQPGHDDVPEDK